jgi:exosortase
MKENKITILAVLVAALFVLCFFPVFHDLVGKWANSDEYSHAFFIIPIILYMAWLKRECLFENQGGGLFGFIFVALANVGYLVALQLEIPTIISITMVMSLVSILFYLAGVKILKELAIPILLLVMVIPIPNQLYSMITLPLQIKVSQISAQAIQLLGIPLFREGNVLSLPDKTFQVVEACSGLRSLISLTTLSLILGYFSLQKGWSKLILLAASLPAAFIVNIIRVSAMILAYHYFRLDLAEGTRHTIMGLVVFSISLILLFSTLRMLEHWERKEKQN